MIYRLRTFLTGLLALLMAAFLALVPAGAKPASGGYQLFERAVSGISTDNALTALENFASPPETASECCNAPNTAALPDNPSQLSHIFGNRRGHLPDTPENRQLLLDTSNNQANHLGPNRFGNDVHVSTRPDGSQVWVETRNGIIQNGGANNPPRTWVEGEGLR